VSAAAKYRIFISHATYDREAALALAEWLKWLFEEESFVATIGAGELWRREIFDALAECSVAIVLGTVNSVQRFWVHAEVGALLALRKRVIPVYVGECEPSQWPELSEIQHCLYDQQGQERLIDAIQQALDVRLEFSRAQHALERAPALTIQSERAAPVHTRRDFIRPYLLQIIESARDIKSELLVAGIANTEFFGDDADEINGALRHALAEGMRARFLFLDPESPSALHRRTLERKRLNTIRIIESCLAAAFETRDDSAGRMQIRLAQDMPVFLCASSERAVCHPYLFSATGANMPIEIVSHDTPLHNFAAQHFETLWGQRWVLFDVGNVLLRFDHRRFSAALANHVPVDAERLHRFVFDAENGPSRNGLLDTGSRDLAWLRDEVLREFGVSVAPKDFEEAWQCIFDAPEPAARECLARVQALGIRVGICSNTNQAHWSRIVALFPELANADIARFLSHELKSVKTDPGFYRRVTDHTRRPAREHLLLDDLDPNLASASAAGFRTLRIENGIDPDRLQQVLSLHCFPDLAEFSRAQLA
jgi:FMN phosphatase YigB (HAD superfamily)